MRAFQTLRSQFVAVVAAAVILSNLSVAGILEVAREGELQTARITAAVDRIAAVFRYVMTIPEEQRAPAVEALSGNLFHYSILRAPPFGDVPMNDEERQLAADLYSGERSAYLAPARVRVIDLPRQLNNPLNNDTPMVEITQPFPNGDGWLTAQFTRLPAPSPAPAILIAALFGTILTGAAAAWLAGRVSRPLSALAYAADEVARGRVAPRLPDTGPDDIRHAAKAFNEMSDRVTRTLESHRQLLSAVGHDLRTPLAAMRITAEFVEDEEVRDRLTRNLDELHSMTEAVLSAARSGPGEERRRVDLATLIESVCDDLIELNQPVTVSIEGLAPSNCRPNEIRRAARNLIENAVRYGGCARVSLDREDDYFVVNVDDDGPGIPANRLEEVFEPFVRLEESRNNATGGSGLGLTLARAIAREHGGDIVLTNRMAEGRIIGLRAALRLPREKQPRLRNETPAAPVEAFAK
ncbi:MAG: HAMP domain-containing protein [Alphaproteobacteria bacterium]|nr:HAMP domain-containing protein [Alphaproteobacteria bacterium]